MNEGGWKSEAEDHIGAEQESVVLRRVFLYIAGSFLLQFQGLHVYLVVNTYYMCAANFFYFVPSPGDAQSAVESRSESGNF